MAGKTLKQGDEVTVKGIIAEVYQGDLKGFFRIQFGTREQLTGVILRGEYFEEYKEDTTTDEVLNQLKGEP